MKALFVAIIVGVLGLTMAGQARGTLPVAAVHDSEFTRGLETMPATNGTPTGAGTSGYQWWLVNWPYFLMPDSVKETLRSDGTAFTVLSDANIEAGQLLTNGQPSYPIFISLGAEAIADDEIAALTNYVAAGGTLVVGSSSFTRTTNGLTRGDFAIANAMGIHMVNGSLENWTYNQTFSKVANSPLVNHIPGGILAWDLPASADEIPWGTWPNYSLSVGHLFWQVQASNALVVAEGDNNNPYLLTSSYGKGTFIYFAALEPFLGHGGDAPTMYTYGILRSAIQGAFASLNLPLPKLSPWPFAYDAALSVRHDFDNEQDQISAITNSAQFEYANGAKGDYYFCTGTLRVQMTNSPSVIASLCAAVTNYGASIGSENGGFANPNNPALPTTNYDYFHWGPDEALDMPASNLNGYANGSAYAQASISNSFGDIKGWLGNLTNGLRQFVAPNFNATREGSLQIESQLGVNVTGEQKLSAFPNYVLSSSNADFRYPFISLPASEWYVPNPDGVGLEISQTMENYFTPAILSQLVDEYYNFGALINLDSHSSSAGTGLAGVVASDYVTYSMSKPRIWPANAAGIYSWWLARSNAQVTTSYSTNGVHSVVQFTIHGASDPATAVEFLVPRPSVTGLQVLTNGVLAGTGSYRTNGSVVKVLVGTSVTNAQISYVPNPEIRTNIFTLIQGATLNSGAPGVLAGALPGAGTNLSAMLVSAPGNGSLNLTNNGGFSYVPASNFTGIDSFTYQASDGVSTSMVSRTLLDVAPPGGLFYDNFTRGTNADPLAPWVRSSLLQLGQWSINGGQLQGSNPDLGTFSDLYLEDNWTNYSVQAQIQFPANGFAGGLDGRLNTASGAKYTVNVYPNGFPGQGTNSLMMLWKFHSWQVLSSSAMQVVTLPQVGTNSHTLKLTFRGNEIIVYFDGTEEIDVVDNNFDGLPPYASGSIGAHFFTYLTPYVMSFQNVLVTTAPFAANESFTTIENRSLNIAAPGVLADDSPGLGTNLEALLVSGPTNGVLTFNTNGSFSYTPAANYVGADSFIYEAADGISTSGVAVVSITVMSNAPPVANNDSYSYAANTPLTVPSPGVLANDTDLAGDPLTAVLLTPPRYGAVVLNSDGSFTYTPSAGFVGTDSFTYQADDGSVTSQVATVTLNDPSAGSLFYDDFTRATDPGPLMPWVLGSNVWTVTGGTLQGGEDASDTYGYVYLTNSWADYAVQGQFQFGPGGYGGGLGARLNQATGARYGAWIYPYGNDLNLIKFQNWTTPVFLDSVNVPALGTNWHTLKLAVRGNEIAAYLDGSLVATVADNNTPYLSGGVSAEMYTYTSPYLMSVDDVVVDSLVAPDYYYMGSNSTLVVSAPGVLGNDTGVYATNLTATLITGPANGTLSLSSNGGFSYTPATNYLGTDSFVYQASDGITNLGTATVTITIGSVEGGPTLPAQANRTIGELTTLIVTNTASDPQVPPLTLSYQLVGSPTNASISTNGVITWTPTQSQGPSTNVFTTIVSDSGTPPLSATNSFTVVVGNLNSAPVLPSQTNVTISGLTTLQVTNTASEVDTHASLSYSLLVAPTNAVISTNGIITWTPVAAQVPSTNVITTVASSFDPLAANGQNLSATNSFTVVVNAVHNGPSLPVQTNRTINELTALVVTNTATDTDVPALTLSYHLVGAPTNASISTNGIITWTPTQSQAPSTNVITTVVSDSGTPSLSATNNFTVVVNDLNSVPVLPAQTNVTISGLTTLNVTNTASESDIHASLSYSLLVAPTNAVISTNGIITWTPVAAQVPSTNVITTVASSFDPLAANSQNLSATNSFTVVVHAVHNGPSLPAQTNRTINELTALVVTNTATDTDVPALTLSYHLVGAPTNATISTNGIITWTPTQSQAPSTNVIKTVVSDSGTPSLSATNSFTVVVNDLNSAPVLPAQTNVTLSGLTTLEVTNTASEADIHASLSYSLLVAPTNAVISTNGIITWTPVAAQVPSTNVITTVASSFDPLAANGQTLSATNSFTVVVNAVHNGPSLPVQTNRTINELTALVATNTATDTDVPALTLSYHLVGAPTNASISTNGIITWTPTQSQAPSTNVIKTVVSDSGTPSLSATNSFTVVVNDLNSAPVLPVLTNVTLSGLTTLEVTNTASEADIHASLSYSLLVAPTNAVISSNGIITWTPVAAQVPSTNVITTVASSFDPLAANGQSLSATNSFTVVVNAVHNGPSLPVQTNQTINELTELVVTNTATDTDVPVLALSYQLVGAPTNASISTNGVITWTPTQSQAPSTNLITTIVSDSGTPPLSATNSFTVVVSDLNSVPVLPAQTNITIGGLTTLDVTNTASEADTRASLSYSLLVAPTNAVISSNGIITWTPIAAQVPSTNVITTVASSFDPLAVNSQNLSATNTFTVVVDAVHNGPSLPVQTNQTINELTELVVTNTATDTDVPALALSYQLMGAPTNASISTNGIITWTPTQSQAPSTNVITTIVSDSGTPPLSATNSFTVVVDDLNSAPVLPVQTNVTISGLATLAVTNTAGEADTHATLSYNLLVAPTNAVISSNGIITWTPVAAQVPSTNVITTVASSFDQSAVNGQNLSATNSFTVVVNAVHNGPSLPVQTNQMINGLTELVVTNTATDTDVPALAVSYQLVGAPTNATISTNGVITWTPTPSQVPSTNLITTIVSDSGTPPLSATNSFTVVVNAVHNGPSLPVQTNQTINELAELVVTNTATDTDVPVLALSYQLVGAPTNASISTNGIITWTPTQSQAPSTNVITTIVSDSGTPSLSATNSFTVVVNDLNSAPVLPAQTNVTISGLTTLDVTNTASESDIHASLSYSLLVAPTNAVISSNGIITWTPVAAQVPSTNVITTVASSFDPLAVNGQNLSATNSFTVVVAGIHNGPKLSAQGNRTINALNTMVVTNTATDTDVPALTLNYQLVGAPTNASISTNGIITWTPTLGQAPSTNVITTIVSDSGTPSLSATNSFTVVVQAQSFQITSIQVTNGQAIVTWNSTAGQTYTLQYKNSMSDTNWQSLSPTITATGSAATATDVVGSTTQRFYRVVWQVTPPSNPNTSFGIDSISVSNNLATITWQAVAGRTYRLQYAGQMGSSNWQSISPDVLAQGALATMTDSVSGVAQRFYRVMRVP